MKTTLAALLLLTGTAHAEPWTALDVTLQLTTSAVLVADWAQTRAITGDCSEANPIMGLCGEKLSPDIYFPVVIVGHALLMHALPRSWRRVAQGITIGVQAHTVHSNYQAGYSVKF